MYAHLSDRAMAVALAQGDAVDLAPYCTGTTDQDGTTLYRLPPTLDIEDKDLVDADREARIWSVGRNKQDGRVMASTDARFYGNPEWECLWLR